MNNEEILTIKEVADYLKVRERQVYRYMNRKSNPLPYIGLSSEAKRVRKEDLIAWIARNVLGGQA
jgi:predicted DNA-binding transcriptional regulator AlpA